jgi:S1-C subfamily serine protease
MKKHTSFSIFIASILLFSSCASIWIPKKQKVAFTTNNAKSEVYADGEMIGEGKSFTAKVSKNNDGLPIVVRTKDCKDQYSVMLKTRRPIAYYPLATLSWLFYIYPGWYDCSALAPNKLWAFNRSLNFTSGNLLVKRKEEDKYLDISNINVNIKDKNKDLRFISIKINGSTTPEDIIKLMKEKEKEDEADYLKAKSKKEAKDAKKAKKGKKGKKMLDEEQEEKEIKLDDTKYSNQVYKTLQETGFVDTVNKVFHDNNNTLILEGSITKISSFQLYTRFSSSCTKSKVYLTWYIKNSYDEIVDSIVTSEYSGEFTNVYYNGYENYAKMLGDAIDISYLKLHSNSTFTKYLKINKDFKIKDNTLSIKSPQSASIIRDKSDAGEASVIVKRKLNGKDAGHGSGFAISEDGYIITNYHVVAGKTEKKPVDLIIITSTGKELPAKLIRSNKYRDLALLKVETTFPKVFKINNTKNFKNMMDVYTIGAPKSIELGQSVSSGIISNLRDINNNTLLQLSMSINFGNSGGPLFDSQGNLQGVIKSKLVGYSTEGVGFAVPGYLLSDYLKVEYK